MELKVVWTSQDKEVAEKMVHMYVYNAKVHKWWDEIELIIWGPSARLLANDTDLQDSVKSMLKQGIQVTACKACADGYGVTDALKALDIEVKYMGVPLSDYLQNDIKVITF